MPLIRCTYWRAVQEFGSEPVAVSDVEALTLIEKRWAVPVTEDDLAALKKSELMDLAEQAGVELPKRDAKGHFVKALSESSDVD
jgi:hypothetical protein